MNESKRILFINSEIFPYLPESKISILGRYLPQGIQENGKEIRSFMPRYGCINERRNQLHEVIRLSGMNIVVNETDRPLVIKVSSISSARMQIYFIENDDYFHRKFIFNDAEGNLFEDNDERAAFFARGVLETVKKLRWKPDLVHCQGWFSHILPIYLKKAYKNDPIFADTKIVVSLYNEHLEDQFSPDLKKRITMHGIKSKDMDVITAPDGINLAKLAIQYADGVIEGDQELNQEVMAHVKKLSLPILPYTEISTTDNTYVQKYNDFYDQILSQNAEK